MIIGSFTYDSTDDTYTGEIRTLTLQRTVVLRPTARTGEREPDYRIIAEGQGAAVEFGAAWKRKSERGQNFLSIILDDPALDRPMHAALFTREQESTANLVWTRPSAKPRGNAPERPQEAPRRASRARKAQPALI